MSAVSEEPTLDTPLAEPVLDLATEGEELAGIPHVVTHINSLVGSAFRAANDKRARSQQRALGMSELGGCRRQAGFKVTGTPESNPSNERTDIYADSREAMIGTLIHDLVLPQIAAMSMTAEIEQKVVLRFEGLPEIPGHADLVDETTLGDLKCTTKDTTILMADGRVLPASQVKAGDRVIAFDSMYSRLVASEVASVADNGEQPIIEIVTESGRTLTVTAEHPVWIQDSPVARAEWVKAEQVEAGSYALVALAAPVEVPDPMPTIGPDDPWLLGLLACWQFTPDNLKPIADDVARSVAMMSMSMMEEKYVAEIWKRNPWIALGEPQIPNEVIQSTTRAWQEWISGFSVGTLTVGLNSLTWTVKDPAISHQMLAMLAGLGVKAEQRLDKGTIQVGDPYSISRMESLLWLRGGLAQRLHNLARGQGASERAADYQLDKVVSVRVKDKPEPTLAIEIADQHTFVTNGLVTHNTVGHNAVARVQTYGASKKHLWQTHGYAQALRDAGHQIDHIALIYIDRSNGQVIHTHYQKFDPSVVEEIREWWLEVNSAVDPMDLPRDERGPGLSFMCDTCPWLRACWGAAAGPGDSSVVASVIHDASDKNAEIERHLAIYNEAAKLEKQAKEDKAYAREVLAAAEAGQYGSYLLKWKQASSYTVVDIDACERLLSENGLPVPRTERVVRPAIDVRVASKVPTNGRLRVQKPK